MDIQERSSMIIILQKVLAWQSIWAFSFLFYIIIFHNNPTKLFLDFNLAKFFNTSAEPNFSYEIIDIYRKLRFHHCFFRAKKIKCQISAFSEMRASIFMRIIDRRIVIKENVSPVQRVPCVIAVSKIRCNLFCRFSLMSLKNATCAIPYSRIDQRKMNYL